MADQKKIIYETLLEGGFFTSAIDLGEEARAKADTVYPENGRMGGNTVIQAFVGHRTLLTNSLNPADTSGSGNFLSLYNNTNLFLKNIGETLAGVDAETAKNIEMIKER